MTIFAKFMIAKVSFLVDRRERLEPNPSANLPHADQPQADQPQADQPQAEQPVADQPIADQPLGVGASCGTENAASSAPASVGAAGSSGGRRIVLDLNFSDDDVEDED